MTFQLTLKEQAARSLFTDAWSLRLFDMHMEFQRTQNHLLINDCCFEIYRKNTGIDLRAILHDGSRHLVIFGAGGYGQAMWRALELESIQVDCFADNHPNASGDFLCGIPVYSPQEAKDRYPLARVLVAITDAHDAILMESQLQTLGYVSGEIFSICLGFGTQYFDCPQVIFGEDELFVDVGCLNGVDCIEFANACGGKYRRIIAFEPDVDNYQCCRKNLSLLNRCDLYQLGLWNEQATLSFQSNAGYSALNVKGATSVQVVSLDEFLCGEKISYLKMDIEGAEMKALCGSAETIRTHKPKLAICVYHKYADISDIPLYIKELRPDYRFALKHYTFSPAETVLYAY